MFLSLCPFSFFMLFFFNLKFYRGTYTGVQLNPNLIWKSPILEGKVFSNKNNLILMSRIRDIWLKLKKYLLFHHSPVLFFIPYFIEEDDAVNWLYYNYIFWHSFSWNFVRFLVVRTFVGKRNTMANLYYYHFTVSLAN